jgi:predicted nucleic acid-binding protein
MTADARATSDDRSCPPRVVLDTNILVANFRPGNALRRLLDGARTGQLELLIPDLAIKEAVNKHREQSEKAVRELDRAAAELRRLGIADLDPAPITPKAACVVYEARLRRALTDARARILPTVNVPHDRLIDRALARQKPFDHRGAGYRDALLWETILHEARTAPLVFCTTDRGDFTTNGTLAPELAEDLLGIDPSGKAVALSTDLTRLAHDLVDVGRVATDDVARSLSTNSGDLHQMLASLLQEADLDRRELRRAIGDGATLAPESLASEDIEIADSLILGLEGIAEVTIEEVETLSTGDVQAYLYVRAAVKIEVELDFVGRDASDGRPRRAFAIEMFVITVGAELEAAFDPPDMLLYGLTLDQGLEIFDAEPASG